MIQTVALIESTSCHSCCHLIWVLHHCTPTLYLCKSICRFDPSSFFCFDTLLLTESADELESAALFLPRPAPLVGVPFSAVPEAAAADLGGRPRRLTGGVSISAFGVVFWLGSTWARWESLTQNKWLQQCCTCPDNNLTFFISFLMIGFSLFSCAEDSVVSLLLGQHKCQLN